jgi:hypothetical protein
VKEEFDSAYFFCRWHFLSVLAKAIDFFHSFKKESEHGFKNALDTGKKIMNEKMITCKQRIIKRVIRMIW